MIKIKQMMKRDKDYIKNYTDDKIITMTQTMNMTLRINIIRIIKMQNL